MAAAVVLLDSDEVQLSGQRWVRWRSGNSRGSFSPTEMKRYVVVSQSMLSR